MNDQQGWHPQTIVAAVRMKGSSLQRLGLENGFNRITFNRAARECFPRAHTIIAEFLGVPRQVIWPQFYHPDGERKTFRQVRADVTRAA